MKKLVLIILSCFFIISCAKVPPLEMSLTADNITVYIHSSDSFYCDAFNGTGKYNFTWRLNNKQLDDCFNSSICSQKFDILGKYEINCEISDGKTTLNQSIFVEVLKIPKKIDYLIAFGDSITYGHGVPTNTSWIYQYSIDFDDVQVYNYAISGATSYSVAEYQLSLFEKDKFQEGNKLIFLWFGANDIKKFISVPEFKANYIKTIDELFSVPNSDIILITIPDVSKLQVATDIEDKINDLISGFGVKLEVKEIGQDIIESYNDIVYEMAEKYDLEIIDMFSYMENFDNSLISSDQFHPNEEGQKEISKTVKKEVDGFFKDYRLY